MKIFGNEVLLRAFAAQYFKFKEEHKSDDGDGLNVSSMFIDVNLAHDVWIVLQDSPSWFNCCAKHCMKKKHNELHSQNKIRRNEETN